MSTRPTKVAKISGWPIAAAVAVLCIFLYYVRVVLLPFVIAGALGFLLRPLVTMLGMRMRRAPRWVSALIVYILALACVGSAAYWLAPLIATDFTDLVDRTPDLLHHMVGLFSTGGRIIVIGKTFDADSVVETLLQAMRSYLLSPAGLAIGSIGIAVIFAGILVLVLLAYFLFSGPGLGARALWIVPPNHRAEVHRLAVKIEPLLRRYFLGLILVVAYTSAMAWLVFTFVFDLPHAALLGITVGVLELVPVLGPATSIALVGLAATQQSSAMAMAGLVAFAIVLRLSIDQVVGPLVLGRATYLHPAVIIFAFLSGAAFLGILGLVLAVPVAATIKIILSHYYEERKVE